MKEIDIIAEAMLDKKAKNVCSLDLTKIGAAIADHFVICNADSTTAVAAISDNIEDMMSFAMENGIRLREYFMQIKQELLKMPGTNERQK